MAMDQLKKGAALSYVNICANTVLNLLLTPLLLRSLGVSGYGLYSLVGAFVGYVGVLDLGLGNAIIRYVARFRAERDEAALGGFVSLCLRLYLAIAVVCLGIGAALLLAIPALFGSTMTPAELSDARGLLALMIVNLALSLPLGAFQAVITGHERFVYLQTLTLGRILVRTALFAALLLAGYKAFAIVLVDTGLTVAVGLLNVAYVRRGLRVRPRRRPFEAAFLRELIAYSSLIFVNMIVDQVYWRLGHVVLGATAGTAPVAVFAIAMQIASYYKQFPLAVSGVYFPRITAMVVRGAPADELLAVFVGAARIQLVVLGLVLGGFILVGQSFVVLWAGAEYSRAWQVALIVIVPLTIHLTQAVGLHILQAKNQYRFACAVYLAAAALNLGLSLLLVPRWGAIGAAAATASSLTAGNIVAITWYHHRRVGLDMRRFFGGLWSGLGPAIAASILLGAVVLPLVPGASWPGLGLRVATFTALYAAAMWLSGLNSRERDFVRGALASLLRRHGVSGSPT